MEKDPEYVNMLETLPPKTKAAWLEGRWDVFEGQFFEDFVDDPKHYDDRRWTHVIRPFAPDKGWRICRSYDFGYNKPFSCAWWAVDYDGIIYRILELYGCTKEPNEGVKWTPDKQFEEIAKIEHQHPWLKGKDISGVADPSIWDASRGESVAETAARHGIYFVRGDNERITGWMQCHYRLQFDEEGYPMSSKTARRSSGRCRRFYTAKRKWKIWTQRWKIMWRTNGVTCACRGRSSRGGKSRSGFYFLTR